MFTMPCRLNPENADRTLIIVTKEATNPYSDVVNTLVSVGNNKKGTAALITFAIKYVVDPLANSFRFNMDKLGNSLNLYSFFGRLNL